MSSYFKQIHLINLTRGYTKCKSNILPKEHLTLIGNQI